MKSNIELNLLDSELNVLRNSSQMRNALLPNLKGIKYWLYLLGL